MESQVAFAKAYPFAIPGRSYLYRGGEILPFDPALIDCGGRVPVLAAGSNQSPAQLHRKFGRLGAASPIPAARGRLHGFDVVYTAKLSGYGAVPATFQASPGTAVTVFVLWLDAAQLARMHETESLYSYDELAGIRVALDDGGELTAAFAYCSRVGCLAHAGAPLAIAEIAAEGRRFAAATQEEVLALVRDRLAPGVPLDRFIAAHIADADLRAARIAALHSDALPLTFPRRTLLEL